MGMNQKNTLTRRTFLGAISATGAACVAAGFVGIPQMAEAADAPATAVNMDALITKEMGAGPIAMEKVKIDTPPKAENGALVRMPISVDHPMDDKNYISTLAIFVDNNPSPLVGKFEFTPASGKVDVELRIKMAKASQVRAIAKSNTGKLYGSILTIDVAEGGCAG